MNKFTDSIHGIFLPEYFMYLTQLVIAAQLLILY